jgi:hypothetical protein
LRRTGSLGADGRLSSQTPDRQGVVRGLDQAARTPSRSSPIRRPPADGPSA